MKTVCLLSLSLLLGLYAVAAGDDPPALAEKGKVAEGKVEKKGARKKKAADQRAGKGQKESAPAKNAEKDKADNAAKTAESTDAAEPKTITVKAEPFKVEAAIDGVFESNKMEEIILRPDTWSGLTVVSAVPHGRRVKKGTTLISLDTQKIDAAITDMENDEATGKLALKQAEVSLQLARKSTPIALAAAKRAGKEARENYDRYVKIDRSENVKDAKFSLESARNSLSYQLEELRQLEKMYKADDLTEETEEIILTRARNRVKSAKHYFAKSELQHNQLMKIGMPREDAAAKQAAEQAAISMQQTLADLPVALLVKEIAVEKQRLAQKNLSESLAKLRKDRELLTVKAPVEGIVYYGQNVRGRWPEIAAVGKLLRPAGTFTANKVVMTIVDPQDLFVRVTVEEKDLHKLHRGATAEIIPTALPDVKLEGELEQVSQVPIADGKFDAVLSLSMNQQAKRLAPGMSCKATVSVYEREDAILVPKAAVKTNGPKKRSTVEVIIDGERHKRGVKTGRSDGDRIEILGGLKPGDRVVVPEASGGSEAAAEKTMK